MAGTIAENARTADEGGCGVVSVMDHFFQMRGDLGDAEEPMLEAYTTLGNLVAVTSRVELQVLVTGITYRHPGILAKIMSALVVLSGGRSILGIGAAWYEREHEGLGVPYPPVAERFERLEETLQIVSQMWSDNNGPYKGLHYRLTETLDSPHPIRRPPIMIGGGGERKTLRLVAKYADSCNIFASADVGPDVFRHKMDVLAEHCANEGTDFDHIHKTIIYHGPPPVTHDTAEAFIAAMEPYAEAGVRRVFFNTRGSDPVAFTRSIIDHAVERLHAL
jgi:F420-dependent oxidoreductase-like protein